MRAAITARRRTIGASLGALPVANVVAIEIGLAVGLILLAIDVTKLLYVAVGVVAVALLIAFLRWSGRWFTQWVGLTLRYSFRTHVRTVDPVPAVEESADAGETVLGPEDARVNLLRLVVPDLVVAHGTDHERRQVGLAWHDGS
ncbi:MAG TPA: type VII secretion protein EccE, partial [Pseudonocardiaceae bacterium]